MSKVKMSNVKKTLCSCLCEHIEDILETKFKIDLLKIPQSEIKFSTCHCDKNTAQWGTIFDIHTHATLFSLKIT